MARLGMGATGPACAPTAGRRDGEPAQRFFARGGIACATLQARPFAPAFETGGGQAGGGYSSPRYTSWTWSSNRAGGEDRCSARWPRRAITVAATLFVLGFWAGDRPSAQQTGSAAPYPEAMFGGLRWRSVGPDRGGRSIAVAGSAARPLEYLLRRDGRWPLEDDRRRHHVEPGRRQVPEDLISRRRGGCGVEPRRRVRRNGRSPAARQHHPGRWCLPDV